MVKVVILAPVHQYSDIRVFEKQAKSLATEGYDVVLIAQSEQDHVECGVRVVPAPKYNSRLVRFGLLFKVLIMALEQKGDIYHLHNPDTLPLALLLKICGKKVVYDVHEDFSQRILIRRWIPAVLRKPIASMVTFLEKTVAKVVDCVIVTQEEVGDRMSGKAVVIENAPIIDGDTIERAKLAMGAIAKDNFNFRLIYIGIVTRTKGLFSMLAMLDKLSCKLSCRIWLIGPCLDVELQEARSKAGWDKVDYLGVLPQWEAFAYAMRADVGLAVLLDEGGHRHINPNKLYEYQALGLPFLASNFNKWEVAQNSLSAGFFVDPLAIDDMASKIVQLFENPLIRKSCASNGKEFVSRYNWGEEKLKLFAVYKKLACSSAK